MQIAQAEFLEAAAAPPVGEALPGPTTHEGGSAITTADRDGPRPRVPRGPAGLYQTYRWKADARGAARRWTDCETPSTWRGCWPGRRTRRLY